MGILTFLQHKEAAVPTPPAKNTSVFVAESTEKGGTEEEIIAERPAFKTAAGTFFRFITGDSRRLLGATAAEAVKTETEANAETGIEPSATKAALVTLAFIAKAEATSITVENNAVAVFKYKGTPLVSDEVHLGTYLVLPGKKIKTKKGAGTVTNVLFSVQLMN